MRKTFDKKQTEFLVFCEHSNSRFLLGDSKSFQMLASSIILSPFTHKNDKNGFVALVRALNTVNISKAEQQEIFRCLSAILHFGNAIYELKKTITLSENLEKYVFAASHLLGIDMLSINVILNNQTCMESIKYFKQLIQFIYESIFTQILSRINNQITVLLPKNDTYIPKPFKLFLIDGCGLIQYNSNAVSEISRNYIFSHMQQV